MTKHESWNLLKELSDIDFLHERSQESPVVIFKHSTSCSISALAWNRFKNTVGQIDGIPEENYFQVNVINERNISMAIAEKYSIRHESPQLLVILKGECIYNASHLSIERKGPQLALENLSA